MGKTIKLASVLLKCSLGTGTADGKKRNSGKSLLILDVFLFICILPLVYYLFKGGIILQELFATVDGDGIMLRFVMFAVSAFIFATGIASCINTFYLSSNLESLLVMPFTSAQITGAKLIVAGFYEYYISFFILVPVLAGYGYAGRESAAYWAGVLLAAILLPVVPLVNAAIVSMLVMRFLGGSKNKERTAALGAVALMAAYMLYDIVRNLVQGMNVSAVEDTIGHMARSISNITAIFPDIPFIADLMVKKQPASLLFSLLMVAASVIVFLATAKFLYFSGAIGMQSTSAAHKKLTARQMERINRRTNIVRSYTKKELKIIFRTPAYYIQCLFLTLGWPIILIIPELFSEPAKKSVESLMSLFSAAESPVYFIFLLFCTVFGITMFTATLNSIAPFAIAREGMSFAYMKQLPVSYKKQLRAKRNAAFFICGIGSGVYMIIGEVILIFVKGFPWWCIPLTAIFNVLILFILVDIEMIIGLLKPKVSWENSGETYAKNPAGFVMFLIGCVVCAALVYGFNGQVQRLTVGPLLFAAAVTAGLGIIAFLIDRIFYFYGEKRLERL